MPPKSEIFWLLEFFSNITMEISWKLKNFYRGGFQKKFFKFLENLNFSNFGPKVENLNCYKCIFYNFLCIKKNWGFRKTFSENRKYAPILGEYFLKIELPIGWEVYVYVTVIP